MSVANAVGKADPASWESRAACLHCDPDLFFPIAPSGPALRQVAQAKAICARCPVCRECLQFALTTHQVHGVWGGTSEEERQLLQSSGPDRMPAQVGGEPGRGRRAGASAVGRAGTAASVPSGPMLISPLQ
jgi:WhiB family redox-sensing transcriptional regulator